MAALQEPDITEIHKQLWHDAVNGKNQVVNADANAMYSTLDNMFGMSSTEKDFLEQRLEELQSDPVVEYLKQPIKANKL